MMIRLDPSVLGFSSFTVASAVLPMGAQAHGTGIYKSEAEAKQRATELGVIQCIKTTDVGCPALMRLNCIAC